MPNGQEMGPRRAGGGNKPPSKNGFPLNAAIEGTTLNVNAIRPEPPRLWELTTEKLGKSSDQCCAQADHGSKKKGTGPREGEHKANRHACSDGER